MEIKTVKIDVRTMSYKPKQRPRYCKSCNGLLLPKEIDICDKCWVGCQRMLGEICH